MTPSRRQNDRSSGEGYGTRYHRNPKEMSVKGRVVNASKAKWDVLHYCTAHEEMIHDG